MGRRTVVGLLGAALLGVVPVGLPAPAHAVEADMVATISTTRARFDDTVTIRGSTTCPGSPAVGSVQLYRRFDGAPVDAWRLVGDDTAADTFAFTFRAQGNADYSVVREADGTCDRSHRGAHLDVLRRMPITINDRLVFSGTVRPAWKRQAVVVQVRRDGRWVAWDSVRTNLRSHWSKRLYARRGTRTYFRAVVRRSTRFQESPSRSVYTHYTSGRVAVEPR